MSLTGGYIQWRIEREEEKERRELESLELQYDEDFLFIDGHEDELQGVLITKPLIEYDESDCIQVVRDYTGINPVWAEYCDDICAIRYLYRYEE